MEKGKIDVQAIKILTKQEVIDKAYRLGFEYEQTRGWCAQCTVAALEEVLKIKNESIFQAAYPLAVGGGYYQSTCGALLGGTMILGYLYGRNKEEFEKKDTLDKRAGYLYRKLYNRFIREYGSCLCKDIQMKLFGCSFDLWNKKDKKAFEKAGGHRDKCPTVVGKACAWTVEIILNEINHN